MMSMQQQGLSSIHSRALRCAVAVIGLSMLLALPALSLEVRDGAPDTYVVKKGDTLWGIAGMYLEQPWRWPELWDVNPQIDNPHLIFPGDRLTLTWVDGEPRLGVQRSRDVTLTPRMRVSPLDLAIPMIPLDEIGAFLRRHRIVSAEDINQSAYIVAAAQSHLVSGAGDTVYGRGRFPDDEPTYGIFRAGEIYRDPVTQEVLGYQAQDIGNAQLLGSNRDDVVELEVTRVTEEVRIADRLLPPEERILDATFQPRAPDQEIRNGYMIAVDGGVSQIGTMDIVVLNRGARDGLEIGHVLAIYQAGEMVFDEVAGDNVRLPDSRAGLCMVFEVAEKASYAVVLKADRALKVMDKVKNP